MQGLHLTADLYRCRCDARWLTEAAQVAEGCRAAARGLVQALVARFAPEWTEQRSLDRGGEAA